MASVTGMTAEAINEELDKMIVSITVDPETGIMYANPRSGDPISAGPALSLDGVADVVWPVGSIYMSTTPTNPATTLGVGTWSRRAESLSVRATVILSSTPSKKLAE